MTQVFFIENSFIPFGASLLKIVCNLGDFGVRPRGKPLQVRRLLDTGDLEIHTRMQETAEVARLFNTFHEIQELWHTEHRR